MSGGSILSGLRSGRAILAGEDAADLRCVDVPLGGELSLGAGQ